MCNLKTRLSDFDHTVSNITMSEFEDGKFEYLPEMQKIFFVVLSGLKKNLNLFLNGISGHLREKHYDLYGIHLNEFDKSELKDIDLNNIEITGFASSAVYSDCFPVLLYMVHLALGENGANNGSWSLIDVFNETTSVLKGLCEKCNLELVLGIEGNLTKENYIYDAQDGHAADNKSCDSIEEPSLSVLDSNLKDLPLMANVNEVLVYHYVLNLDVSFQEKSIFGTEILFLKPDNDEVAQREFQMCLDCTLIDIESVTELVLPDNFDFHFHQEKCCCQSHDLFDQENAHQTLTEFCMSCKLLQQNYHYNNNESNTSFSTTIKSLNFRTLPYAVYGWCLRVWNIPSSRNHWPKCVVIKYKTKPIGPSLAWCKDQDGK